MEIHKKNYDVMIRTPTLCQNAHHRWMYHIISQGEVSMFWGDKECRCPTGEINEGFRPCGASEVMLEEM